MESLPIRFSSTTSFAIGVSGGIDSLSLIFFMVHWLKYKGWSKDLIHPIIIDHQLRDNSSSDALKTIDILKNFFGLKGQLILWEHSKIDARIQETARQARYELFSKYCRKRNIKLLLTAHHQDDQIETFFIRASSSSGVKGLKGIPRFRKSDFGYIARPLLDFSKKELKEILISKNIPWVEDCSNESLYYKRNRWRVIINQLKKSNINTNTVLEVMKNLSDADYDLDLEIHNFLQKYFAFQPYGWWKISYPIWILDFEIFKRILDFIAQNYWLEDNYPPRGRQYNHNYKKLQNKEPVTFKGLYLVPQKSELLIFREVKCCPIISIKKEEESVKKIVWDNRFIIPAEEFLGEEGFLGPLTENGWQKLEKEKRKTFLGVNKGKIPGYALFSLPVLWNSSLKSFKIIRNLKGIKI